MIITDLSQTPPLNKTINLKDVALHKGPTKCLSLLTTGTFTGTPKLEISQDGEVFYPLYDEEGQQIVLEIGKMVFLNFSDLYLKVDLTDVSSENLKISIQ